MSQKRTLCLRLMSLAPIFCSTTQGVLLSFPKLGWSRESQWKCLWSRVSLRLGIILGKQLITVSVLHVYSFIYNKNKGSAQIR